MSTKFKLTLFLVPALAAIVYLVWWLSPTQVILRRLDAALELADISALRLASPDQLPARLNLQVAPTLEVTAPHPIPSGSFTPEELAVHLSDLHSQVASCRITREEAETTVFFPNRNEARVATPIKVSLSWGRGSGLTRPYQAKLRFTKTAAGWLLDQVVLVDL